MILSEVSKERWLADYQKLFEGATVRNQPIEKVDAKEFYSTVKDAIRKHAFIRSNLTMYKQSEYARMRTYLSADKSAGYAINREGELVSVFSTKGGMGDALVQHAIQNGAKKLDAFDVAGGSRGLIDLYRRNGFKEYNREPNWTPGGPDVVFMHR